MKVEELKTEVRHVEEKLSRLNESLTVLNMELAATRQDREADERQHGECAPAFTLTY